MTKIDAWWFAAGDRLPHGDNRPIVIGESHSVNGDIVLCKNALHASRDPFDALRHAPGAYLYKVRCWGDVAEDGDKIGARNREYLEMRDATNMLRRSAREQALSFIHLWEPPEVVRRYLDTGDETIRAAAWDAASAAIDVSTAWYAPWTAASAAAWDAVNAAAWTVSDSAAAWTVSDSAADSAAARNAAGQRFNDLVNDLFRDAA